MEKAKDKKSKKYFSSNKKSKSIDLNENKEHGAEKCDNCGSTSFSHDLETGKLICDFCKMEVANQEVTDLLGGVSKLEGKTISKGAQKINKEISNIVTLKCSGCGAEVIIDTEEALHATCHWCRSMLSINDQIENGVVPDIILPFKISKEEAQESIRKFINKRSFFAKIKFLNEFKSENIKGVYLPYYVVDINGHIKFEGKGEKQIGTHFKDDKTYYDAKTYNLLREFDIEVDNLTLESSKDKLEYFNKDKSNEIINAIMPFDIENSMKWNANYLKGYTSENRDVEITNVKSFIEHQVIDISKHKIKSTLEQYDRGVSWRNIDLDIKGEKWISALLPVWIYSFKDKDGKEERLSYIAVNGRTKETMGNVPINKVLLNICTFLIVIIGLVITYYGLKEDVMVIPMAIMAFIFAPVLYMQINGKYGNYGVRHKYEQETKSRFKDLKHEDRHVRTRYTILNRRIENENSEILNNRIYLDTKYKLYSKIKKEDILSEKMEQKINEFKNKL